MHRSILLEGCQVVVINSDFTYTIPSFPLQIYLVPLFSNWLQLICVRHDPSILEVFLSRFSGSAFWSTVFAQVSFTLVTDRIIDFVCAFPYIPKLGSFELAFLDYSGPLCENWYHTLGKQTQGTKHRERKTDCSVDVPFIYAYYVLKTCCFTAVVNEISCVGIQSKITNQCWMACLNPHTSIGESVSGGIVTSFASLKI